MSDVIHHTRFRDDPNEPEDVLELGEPAGLQMVAGIFAEMMDGATPWFFAIGGGLVLWAIVVAVLKL